MNQTCDLVDDYLAAALSEATRTAFEGHLETCLDCRMVVSHDQRICDLLDQAVLTERVPSGLGSRVSRAVGQSRGRRVNALLVIVAATVLLVVSMFLSNNRPDGEVDVAGTGDIVKQDTPLGTTDSARSDEQVALTPTVQVELPRNVIAVPVESTSSNVTIIMVYQSKQPMLGSSQR